MVYNLASFHFMCLGYNVVDLKSMLKSNGNLKGNYRKNIKSILSANSGSNLRVDLLVAIKPKWKSRRVTIPLKLTWGVRKRTFLTDWNIPVMQMKLEIIEISTQETISSGESADTLRLIELNEDENGKLDVKAIPIRYLVQRNLSHFISDFPPCSQPETLEAEYRFPVIFYVDQTYRYYYSRGWKSMLKRRLVFVNDIFKHQFGIEFYIKGFRTWSTTRQDSLRLLLHKLLEDTQSKQNTIIIGVTHDDLIKFNWFDRNVIGIAKFIQTRAVVKDLPTTVRLRDWDALDEAITLAHELGHVFSATHILDQKSLMYPTVGTMSYEFDDYNKAIINCTKKRLFQLESKEQLETYTEELLRIHRSFGLKNTYFVGTLGFIAEQYSRTGNPLDSLSAISNVSALYHAVMGNQYLKEKNWDKAKDSFLTAIELDPDLSYAYLYLSHVYKELNEEGKAKKYWKKAEKKGFKNKKID